MREVNGIAKSIGSREVAELIAIVGADGHRHIAIRRGRCGVDTDGTTSGALDGYIVLCAGFNERYGQVDTGIRLATVTVRRTEVDKHLLSRCCQCPDLIVFMLVSLT